MGKNYRAEKSGFPKMVFIGIDPGAGGGLAFVRNYGNPYAVKMPATEYDVLAWLKTYGGKRYGLFNHEPDRQVRAVVEWIHPAIQGVGKSSMSKLYGSYTALRMALTAAKIPFDVVQAAKWQRAIGVSKKDKAQSQTVWKNRLKARAQQLFPNAGVTLATCDALLIAEYCRRSHIQNSLKESK